MVRTIDARKLALQLDKALFSRDIGAGFALLGNCFTEDSLSDLHAPNSIAILLSVVQWVDLGYRDIAFMDRLVANLPERDPLHLTVSDFLKLKIVRALHHIAHERLQEALDLLQFVLGKSIDLEEGYLRFVSHFWKGRAHRKRGEYQEAYLHILAARESAGRLGAAKLIAVTKIHQSWLEFQKGDRRHAFELLDEAESELRPTGHALSLGNIESARGRFIRRSGDYSKSLRHFENAIEILKPSYPTHPNLARALVNAAYVKRLISLSLRPKKNGGQALGATHAQYLKIAKEALVLLQEAEEIYSMHQHQGGTGAVLVNKSHIHLECGDIDRAAVEAKRAFDLGEKNGDQILMSRARSCQAAVELARSEEQLGESADVAMHATLAEQYATDSIEMALHTQNNRLLAEAYINRGLIAADDFFQEWAIAKDAVSKATALLNKDDKDHLYRQLGILQAKILDSAGINDTLRRWCNGQLGDKTFQEIQEEFAEIVIPKVWVDVGKNASMVAQKLSMSPKKVRRILKKTQPPELEN